MLKGVKPTLPVFTLIGVNFIPVCGVLFFGWNVSSILVLYWLESVVIGLLNIPKIIASQGNIFGKIFDSLFFTIHFGGFCLGHAVFLKEMFEVEISPALLLTFNPLSIAAVSFFISHLISMLVNFFGKQEFQNRNPRDQMFQPYGRVMIMHVTILIGGFLMQKFGAPVYALFILIAIKTLIDLAAHTKEHKLSRDASPD